MSTFTEERAQYEMEYAEKLSNLKKNAVDRFTRQDACYT